MSGDRIVRLTLLHTRVQVLEVPTLGIYCDSFG